MSQAIDAPEPSEEDLRRSIRALADAVAECSEALAARTWPKEVSGSIADLVRQLQAQVTPLRQAADKPTGDEVVVALAKVPGATAAEQVRDAFRRAGA